MVARNPLASPQHPVLPPAQGSLASNSRFSGNLGERSLIALLSVVSDAVVFLGPRYQLRHANAAALELFGVSLERLIGDTDFVAETRRAERRECRLPHRFRLRETIEVSLLDWPAGVGWIVVARRAAGR